MMSPEQHDSSPDAYVLARRTFLFLGMLTVAGCAAPKAQQAALPSPVWPPVPDAPPQGSAARHATGPASPAPAAPGPTAGGASATPAKLPQLETMRKGPVPFAYARRTWAKGSPNTAKLNPMLPPRWITVHHEGWRPFYGDEVDETRMRLEVVRSGHHGRGWGDIGYHFVVDRAGRVWEGRQLKYQGAHVEKCNEHNIGVMCLGNFMEQSPTPAQLRGLQKTVQALRTYYRIPGARVRSHREWPSAKTACPGTNLQVCMTALRRGDALA